MHIVLISHAGCHDVWQVLNKRTIEDWGWGSDACVAVMKINLFLDKLRRVQSNDHQITVVMPSLEWICKLMLDAIPSA